MVCGTGHLPLVFQYACLPAPYPSPLTSLSQHWYLVEMGTVTMGGNAVQEEVVRVRIFLLASFVSKKFVSYSAHLHSCSLPSHTAD